MELKRFLNPLIRWWWLVAAATLVAGISSYYSVSQQAPIFLSRTTLMVGRVIDNPNPSNADFSVGQQLAATYVNLANTEQMRRRTMEALGLDFLPEYAVQPIPNTELIAISVTDTSPERAQAVANELARQLVLQSPTTPSQEEQERRAFVEGQLASMQKNIQATEVELEEWRARLSELISARDLGDAQTQISALETKLNTLQSNYASLLATTAGGATNTIRIVDPASLPGAPIGPSIALTVLTAASVGFFLAAGAAYALEYLDDTIHSRGDVERASGLPTLVSISRIQVNDNGSKLITLQDPRSPLSETFRALRTAIQYSNQGQEQRSLLITSPNPIEGKSLVAANLAVVLAQAANKVLLIDADLHRPVLHKIFGMSNEQGLTTILLPLLLQVDAAADGIPSREFTPAQRLFKATHQPGLYVLSSGPLPELPAELLGSVIMKELLGRLSARFDYIVLDSPPLMPVTDATVLSTQVDSVMVLVDAGHTRRKQLKETIARLRKVDANLIGVILNRVPTAGADYRTYASYARSNNHRENGEPVTGEIHTNGHSKFDGLLRRLWRKQKS